jgi:hypothetical protein
MINLIFRPFEAKAPHVADMRGFFIWREIGFPGAFSWLRVQPGF